MWGLDHGKAPDATPPRAALHALPPGAGAASYTEEGGPAALSPLLDPARRPTAVVAGNGMIALGVLHGFASAA